MKLFLTTAATVVGTAAAANSTGTSCTALVVGGLGSQQAYVAGALSALANTGAEYDVVVSTGASIIAAQAAATSSASQLASQSIKSLKAISKDDAYASYPGGVEQGFNSEGGFYNETVEGAFYSNILASPSGKSTRTVVAVATSLTTTLQTPLSVSASDVQASTGNLLASATDPTTFAAVQLTNPDGGYLDSFVSGEVRGQVNVFEAVAQCRAKGAADADITVDVVYTAASRLKTRDVSKYTTLLVEARKTSIENFVAAQQDVLYAKWAYPDVKFRYDVSPEFGLITANTDYSLINRLGMISRGTSDAKAAIKKYNAGTDCDPATQAPSCTEDEDCVSWATKNCLSKSLPKQGRCLAASVTVSGTCSFNATEIDAFRASLVTQGKDATATCIAAAFSGGGDRGAYEAGVVRGLVEGAANPADIAYEVAAGVSVGSIVSSALSKFPIGQEADAADFMVTTALDITRDVIYKNWTNLVPFIGPKGVTRGLLFESGLFDSSGERAFLEKSFPNTAPAGAGKFRTHTALATDMAAGEGKTFSFVGSQGTDAFIDALMASSAIPGAFPMQVIDGVYYSDGGTIATIDAYAAAQTCRALGYSTDNIQIDTIGVAGIAQVPLPPGVALTLTTEQVSARVQQIQQIDQLMAVIDFYRNAEPGIFRLNIFPSTALPGTGLDFNVTDMKTMVSIGEGDGKAAAQNLGKSGLPKSCQASTTLTCGADKDCFNYNVQMCNSQLTTASCDHASRTCTFAK